MENPKYQIFVGKDDQFYFHLQARNGEIILASEGYTAKHSTENGIESVRENSPDDSRYERKTSTDNQHYFVLKATNGEIIGTSEMYTTTAAMENGLESVKENGSDAPVEDLT